MFFHIIPLVALIILACLLFSNISKFSYPFLLMLKYLSYLLIFLVLVLSYWFNHGRMFFIVLHLAGTQLILLDMIPSKPDPAGYLSAVYAISAILVPLNLIIFSLMEDKGIITSSGRKRFLYILGTFSGSCCSLFYWQPQAARK